MTNFSRRRILNSGLFYLLSGMLGCSVVKFNASQSSQKPIKNEVVDIPQESGSLISEIARLKQLVFRKNSNVYKNPTEEQQEAFKELAKTFIQQDLTQAYYQAEALNYEVIQFTDTDSNSLFYSLREKLIQGQQTLGWGSYFLNPNAQIKALIEVPHPLFDQNTPEIAIEIFLKSSARGFLMAGAHRHTNGKHTADVCDPINSIFQIVHQAWMLPQTPIWQIHGFNLKKYPRFPQDTQLVISNGRGEYSPEIMALRQELERFNFQGYVYGSNPRNPPETPNIDGTLFSPLGATQNVQGIEANRRGNPFIHLEIERQIRQDPSQRVQISTCLAQAIQAKV